MPWVRRWRDVSITKKLFLVAGIMAALILCELATLNFAMSTLSATRAFVGGEGLWSKSQKNAAISLRRYSRSHDEADYQAFLKMLEVPEGDRQARLELLKPEPDLERVREGFLRGRIHPEDIEPMVHLLQRFSWTPDLRRALEVWARGDELLLQYKQTGLAIHAAALAADPAREEALQSEIGRLNDLLTGVEDEFSFELGATSRRVEWALLSLLSGAVFLVEGVGLTLMFRTTRSMSRGLSSLTDAAARVGAGDFSQKLVPESEDEIGQLARSLGVMSQTLERSYSELEARVTARTRELAASRDQLDVILRAISDGVTVIDDQRRIVFINEQGATMSGFRSVEDALGSSPDEPIEGIEILDEQGAPFPAERLPSRLALQGVANPPEVVLRYRVKRSGEDAWSLTKSAPVFDETGKTRLVVTITKNFTERKRAEDAVAFLGAASKLFSASLDLETTLQSVGQLLVPRFADGCAIELVEQGALRPVTATHVDPEKVSALRAWVAGSNEAEKTVVLRSGKSEFYGEGSPRLQRPGAEGLGLRSALVVPLLARRQVLGVLTLIHSESGRAHHPDDVPLMEQLGRRAGIAVDNGRLYHEAQEAIRARDDFLAIAGHELRTPLTALLMNIQSSERVARKQQGDGLVERLERATRSGLRLERLISQLLDVSKISAGRLKLELEPFDLAQALEEVVSRFSEESAKAISPISMTRCEHLEGTWDRQRIEQVISNLLGNAIKYGKGKPVEVALSSESGEALLRVTDHGIGINPEDRLRIFERFERAVAGREFGGFGLGLWISRQIVEASGGAIEVDSAPGQGATFRVRLPRAPVEKADAPS